MVKEESQGKVYVRHISIEHKYQCKHTQQVSFTQGSRPSLQSTRRRGSGVAHRCLVVAKDTLGLVGAIIEASDVARPVARIGAGCSQLANGVGPVATLTLIAWRGAVRIS